MIIFPYFHLTDENTPPYTHTITAAYCCICDGRPTLALIPGDRRADERKVAAAVGAKAARVARPEEVVAATGFEPGGVAPFPLPGVSRTVMANEFLVHDRVWVGAGSDHTFLYTMYDTLTEWDFATLQPKPGLAESWSSPDANTLVPAAADIGLDLEKI